MTSAVLHDFPGMENGSPKFHDFPGPVGTLCVHCELMSKLVLILCISSVQQPQLISFMSHHFILTGMSISLTIKSLMLNVTTGVSLCWTCSLLT